MSLENGLHACFSARRVNWANNRKELFFASPADVRKVLSEKLGNLLEFAEHVTATEYLQSAGYWPEHIQSPQRSRGTDQLGPVVPLKSNLATLGLAEPKG